MKIPDDLWFESNFFMAYKYLFSFFYLKNIWLTERARIAPPIIGSLVRVCSN